MTRSTLLALALLAACKSTKSDSKTDDPRTLELAQLGVKKLAFEAYPTWAAAHADKACPDTIDELVTYVTPDSAKDPWGNAYKMQCGSSLPPGARGIAVWSLGPDGKDATADDIKSWQ